MTSKTNIVAETRQTHDAARVELLLNDLRLPGVKLM